MIPLDETDKAEFRREMQQEKRYKKQLVQHPHCQDPDHPGCEKCEPEEYKNTDVSYCQ